MWWGMRSRNSCRKWFKLNPFVALFGFSLNIHPNTKVNILGGFGKNNFLFLILVSVSLIASWLVSKFLHLFISIAPILFDIYQNLSRNVIIFFIDDISDLRDIILAPGNFIKVVLWLSLSKNFINRIDYIFTDLTVFYCFFDRFVLRLSPKTDIWCQVFLIIWIWKWVAF